VNRLEEKLRKEETKAFLSGKYDPGDAIFTITAGAGGQDAQDWRSMLLRMYQRYAERKGFNTSIIHQSPNQVSMGVTGSFAYGFLKNETGVHRLVRISPFSAKALRHTSFAAVEALPEIRLQEEKIEIKPEEIVLEVSKSSGPGGQNVNKRETAVRIVHIPTGVSVESQTQRSQQQNKERALEILAAKLYQIREQEKEKELAALRQAQGKPMAIEWGSQIRSYVLHPYQMVKDHRTNVESSDTQGILDGTLDEFIVAEIRK
jgi:peptide chain release factor 2